MKGFVKRRPVSAELAEALKQTDPERGEELAKKLDTLYGISLTSGVTKFGDFQACGITVRTIADRYALHQEPLLQ